MNNLKIKVNKLFWFLGKGGDFSKDRHLIIHQTLALGSMQDVQRLFREYGQESITHEFQKPVSGLYAPAVFHFFEHILGVEIKNSGRYIKNIHGKTSFRHS
ncbi:MAG: hypothetical protein ACD_11C00102G0002 [uncultured bacterium]|nr:MAG: hypothetical protein ACD_11C00102G0002 [uncultured bacterium]